MIKQRDFKNNKKQTLEKLNVAKKKGLVDKKIIPILDLINDLDNYYTSSSCYGRIVFLQLPEIGDKKNARFLGKWHHKIKPDDILNLSNTSDKGLLWLLAQSPIIHVFAKDFDSADKLVKTSVSCGFKHSGFKTADKNIIVEISSTERLDSPIGCDGKLFCDKNYLDLLVKISNDVIDKSVKKLEKLKESLINFKN